MKLRRQRWVIMMRFAGGDDPVELLRSTGGGMQRFLGGPCAERNFVFAIGRMGQRFDSGTATKFAGGHAESAVDFLPEHAARTSYRARRDDRDLCLARQVIFSVCST